MPTDLPPGNLVRYTPRRLRSMTERGIEYVDDRGAVCFIAFAACRAAWVRHVNASSQWATTTLREDQTRCVGWRDWFDPAPDVEFFTTPRTRFVFAAPPIVLGHRIRLLEARGRRNFNTFQDALHATGWSTFDLG